MYENPNEIKYYSKRYDKTITVPQGYLSDGATYAIDFCPKSWYVHDWGCGNYLGSGPKPKGGQWDDGTKMSNWQLSAIFHDILMEEGYWFIAKGRFVATFLFGGGAARNNGMFKVNER